MKKLIGLALLALLVILLQGCFHSSHEVEVKPVEIKPVHITIDVNVKVEKQLDDFFGDLDKKAEKISAQDKTTGAQNLPEIQTGTVDTNKINNTGE